MGRDAVVRAETPATLIAPAPWRPIDPRGPYAPSPRPRLRWAPLLVRQWPIVLAAALVGMAAGMAAVRFARPAYTAQATLQIERQAPPAIAGEAPGGSGAQALGEEFFQTQYGLLRSRSLAARASQSLKLAQNGAFLAAMTGAAPSPAPLVRRTEEVIGELRGHLAIAPQTGSRLVSIAFSSPDPNLSARVVNAFAENFIAWGLDRQFESASGPRDTLGRRMAEAKARLEASDKALLDGGADADVSQAAAPANADPSALAAARGERISAETRWRAARKAARAPSSPAPSLPAAGPIQPGAPPLATASSAPASPKAKPAVSVAELEAQYRTALKAEQALAAQPRPPKVDPAAMRARGLQHTILQREVDTDRTLYEALLQRYKDASVTGGVAANDVSIVDRGVPPLTPSGPGAAAGLILGAIAGLALGAGMARARESLDDTIRSPADLEAATGLPVLATEAAGLRLALQASGPEGFPRTLMVTSAAASPAKTAAAWSIAEGLADLGYRVLVVDADLRRPALHALAGAGDMTMGLANVLADGASLKDAAKTAGRANLFVIAAGAPPVGAGDLLAGPRFAQFLAEARFFVDTVIIDGPPVAGLADAPAIGAAVAATLIVAEAGRTRREELRAAAIRLSAARVLGAYLTGAHGPARAADPDLSALTTLLTRLKSAA